MKHMVVSAVSGSNMLVKLTVWLAHAECNKIIATRPTMQRPQQRITPQPYKTLSTNAQKTKHRCTNNTRTKVQHSVGLTCCWTCSACTKPNRSSR
jgi:hypothetical protein